MKIKVASINPTMEKASIKGKLYYSFVPKRVGVKEACKAAAFNLNRMVPLIEQAAREGAKMACLPEDLLGLTSWKASVPAKVRWEGLARTWDMFCRTLSAAARKYGIVLVAGSYEVKLPAAASYAVVAPRSAGALRGGELATEAESLRNPPKLSERRRVKDGKGYNSAAIFDERGHLLGTYHKVQLAKGEDRILTRGDSFPVFPTRYGKVGIFICWDIIYPEVTQALMLNGAEILFQPTWGHSGHQADFTAQTRAHDAVAPLVISMWCGNGRIIDRDGKILAQGGGLRDWRGLIPDQIIYAEVDPKAKRKWIVHKDLRAALIEARQVEAFRPLCVPPEKILKSFNA